MKTKRGCLSDSEQFLFHAAPLGFHRRHESCISLYLWKYMVHLHEDYFFLCIFGAFLVFSGAFVTMTQTKMPLSVAMKEYATQFQGVAP